MQSGDGGGGGGGMTCDMSGICPIVGVRYHLRGEDYDLICQAEYDKLYKNFFVLEVTTHQAIIRPYRRMARGGAGGCRVTPVRL